MLSRREDSVCVKGERWPRRIKGWKSQEDKEDHQKYEKKTNSGGKY